MEPGTEAARPTSREVSRALFSLPPPQAHGAIPTGHSDGLSILVEGDLPDGISFMKDAANAIDLPQHSRPPTAAAATHQKMLAVRAEGERAHAPVRACPARQARRDVPVVECPHHLEADRVPDLDCLIPAPGGEEP